MKRAPVAKLPGPESMLTRRAAYQAKPCRSSNLPSPCVAAREATHAAALMAPGCSLRHKANKRTEQWLNSLASTDDSHNNLRNDILKTGQATMGPSVAK